MIAPRVILSLWMIAFSAHGALGQSPAAIPSDQMEPIAIAMRVSKELLVELTRDEIEMSIPVSRQVEGIPLTGTASGKGITHIELNHSDEVADFVVSVTGNAVGDLRSDVGPAIVRLTTRANFTAQKQFHFDGASFRSDPSTTNNRNCTTIDRICAKRRGPIGKLVESVGRKMARKSLREVNLKAQDITGEMLNSTFDEAALELIDKLNETTRFDELWMKHFPETESWSHQLATRSNYLLVAVGPADATVPDFLLDPDAIPEAHIELWLQLTPGQNALLEMIAEFDVAYDLLLKYLPKDDVEELAQDVKMSRQDDWTVIKAGVK